MTQRKPSYPPKKRSLLGDYYRGISGYRYYSPSLGRWINRDPIEEEGGFNLYAFVGNSPIRYIDSLGLECVTSSCDSLSIHFSFSLYEILGATIDLAVEGKVCDCCCDGEVKEKAYLQGKVSAGGDVGIGVGAEVRFFGQRAGLLFKGPNIPIYAQANITRECDGNICGGIGHEWSGRLQGSISGGVGPVGGAVAAYLYATLSYGIMADSSAISFYIKVDGGRDVQTELNLWIVQWQHTFGGGVSRNWVDIKVPIYEF